MTDCKLAKVDPKDNQGIREVLIVAAVDTTITIWDRGREEIFRVLRGHHDVPVQLEILKTPRFHTAGETAHAEFLRSASYDGEIRTWKLGNSDCFADP